MVRVFVNVVDTFVSSCVKDQLVADGHEVVASCTEIEYLEDGIQDVEELCYMADKQGVTDLVKTCDVAILSLHEGGHRSMSAVVRAYNQEDVVSNISPKKLICISSMMTWARTPVTEESGKFTEDSYKTRTGTGKFTHFRTAETQVLAMGEKAGLTAHIVAPGLMYGQDEGDFQSLFKESWLGPEDELTIVSRSGGKNRLPTIYIKDLAAYVATLAVNTELSKAKPISFAVDKSLATLEDIAKAVSSEMGEGKVRAATTEEVEMRLIEDPELSRLNVDFSNCSIDGSLIESVNPERFRCMSGPIANMGLLVQQYKTGMDLRPVRLVVVGPPGSGVQTLADSLAEKYYLPAVDLDAEAAVATKIEVPNEVDEEGNETGNKTDPALQAFVDEVTRLVEAKQTPNTPALIAQVLWPKLACKMYSNKGFVSTNIPSSHEVAQAIFMDKGEDGQPYVAQARPVPGAPEPTVNRSILPSKVVVITCDNDDWLKEQYLAWSKATHEEQQAKAKAEAEAAAAAEGGDEGGEGKAVEFDAQEWDAKAADAAFTAAITEYRGAQKDETKTPLSFFEETCEMKCLQLAVGPEQQTDLLEAAATYIEGQEGAPYNFHPTPEEALVAMIKKEEEEKAAAEKAKRDAEEAAQKEADEKRAKEEAEAARLKAISDNELEILETRSLPLRAYLMANVIPTLTEGMLEAIKVQPADSVDFMAEYLFKRVKDKQEEEARVAAELAAAEEQPQVDEEGEEQPAPEA